MRLWRIGNPTWCRQQYVGIERELQREHQFLGARADQDLIGLVCQLLGSLQVAANRISQCGQTFDRQIGLFMGMAAQCIDDADGNREG